MPACPDAGRRFRRSLRTFSATSGCRAAKIPYCSLNNNIFARLFTRSFFKVRTKEICFLIFTFRNLTMMKGLIIVFCSVLLIYTSKGQTTAKCATVSKADSAYIFKELISIDNGRYRIDEIFIDNYWRTDSIKAQTYFYKAAFIRSITPADRVIMLNYLSDKTMRNQTLRWIYDNLKLQKEFKNYFIGLGYCSIKYSELSIPRDVVKKYDPNAE